MLALITFIVIILTWLTMAHLGQMERENVYKQTP